MRLTLLSLALFGGLAACGHRAPAKAPPGPPAVDFARDVQPVLAKHCVSCHGPDKQKGGLRLDSREGWQTGGDSGPARVPGKRDECKRGQAISYAERDLKMPPKRKLKESEIADLKL